MISCVAGNKWQMSLIMSFQIILIILMPFHFKGQMKATNGINGNPMT